MGRKQSLRALEQCERRGPRSDVNHVDGHHRIRRLQWPGKLDYIKVKRNVDVSSLLLPDPQGNRLAKPRIWIGRLPREVWERLGEMHNVLSRPAGDL